MLKPTVIHNWANLVPRVLRLLGQRFGRQERLWGNGIFSIFLIGYSGNNEIGEAEAGSMLTLPSTMSRTSQETSAIFQRGQQVTLQSRTQSPQAPWSAVWSPERLWDNALIQFFWLVDSKTIGSGEWKTGSRKTKRRRMSSAFLRLVCIFPWEDLRFYDYCSQIAKKL